MTEDQFKCLILVTGLQSPPDPDIWTRLLRRIEQDPDLTLQRPNASILSISRLMLQWLDIPTSLSLIWYERTCRDWKVNLPQFPVSVNIRIMPGDSQLVIHVKFNGQPLVVDSLGPEHTLGDLKQALFQRTRVLAETQKLLGLRACNNAPVDDSTMLSQLVLKPSTKIMLIGSTQEAIEDVNRIVDTPTDVLDDFEIRDEDIQLCDLPENLEKVARRSKSYKPRKLCEPRIGKHLLVLDVDYTIFDHLTPAENARQLARPYLFEFLKRAYVHYDIAIWSATSMTWILAKLGQLGIIPANAASILRNQTTDVSATSQIPAPDTLQLSNDSQQAPFRISLLLDATDMISVHFSSHGVKEPERLFAVQSNRPHPHIASLVGPCFCSRPGDRFPLTATTRRHVKLSLCADREVWSTRKAEEMEDVKNAGNVCKLFHLIRSTGPRKPLVSEITRDQNGSLICSKVEVWTAGHSTSDSNSAGHMLFQSRILAFNSKVLEQRHIYRQPTILAFLVFKSAFDSVVRSESAKDSLYDGLGALLQQGKSSDIVVVAGDMNFQPERLFAVQSNRPHPHIASLVGPCFCSRPGDRFPLTATTRRHVKLSLCADREVWSTRKAEEMEDVKNAGNVCKLFHLIRSTGPRKPLVSEITRDQNGSLICSKVEVWTAGHSTSDSNSAGHMLFQSRILAFNSKIRPYRDAHVNRTKDRELRGLALYLELIAAREKDFTLLHHNRWEKYVSKYKRTINRNPATENLPSESGRHVSEDSTSLSFMQGVQMGTESTDTADSTDAEMPNTLTTPEVQSSDISKPELP
ncbi:hypothetical protein T265_02133 [Opisthorchis viverrini]|uniref:Ubiquitin-like domain-containing CTD phosphatase 1 n=1 Tax=Opisthorchis viverrini TaxID=6198 RepID=A0A075AIH0_OPIVI|nr:hypothetical protein T265_02133 [Opisthorchis viverrini]KER31619.1 hypothetical protein T265_02133 [Opisthorchis viverrini]